MSTLMSFTVSMYLNDVQCYYGNYIFLQTNIFSSNEELSDIKINVVFTK